MKYTRTFLMIVVMISMSVTLFAADDKKAPSKEDMQKMMEAWQKIAAPGPQHAMLAKLAGDWTFHLKMWMDPKAPPTEADGTDHAAMLLDGRFLQSEHHSEMMGMPYSGIGIMGFDNSTQQFQFFSFDNMGTMIVTAKGGPAADNTITLNGRMDEPTTGEKDMPFRYTYKVTDDDHYTITMYSQAGTPKELKVMEIACIRKK